MTQPNPDGTGGGGGTTAFDATTEAHRDPSGDGSLGIDLDPSWLSLSGIHGGYLTAVAVRAAAGHASGRSLRTATTTFLRSTRPGPASLTVSTLRDGRSRSTLQVDVVQDGQATATTRMTFVAGVTGETWEAPSPPTLAARDDCIPLRPPEAALHFGHATALLDPSFQPFSSGPLARVAGYVRPLEPRPIDEPWLVMILDWFPPSPFTHTAPPVGGPSIDYTVHVHRTAPPLGPDEWLSAELGCDISTDGLALERGTVRDGDGRVLAESFHTRWTATG